MIAAEIARTAEAARIPETKTKKRNKCVNSCKYLRKTEVCRAAGFRFLLTNKVKGSKIKQNYISGERFLIKDGKTEIVF